MDGRQSGEHPDRISLLGALLLFTRWRRTGRLFVAIAALAAIVVGYLPLSVWVMRPLETRFPAPEQLPPSVAGIVVLGGALDTRQTNRFGQPALNGRAERITAFVDLSRGAIPRPSSSIAAPRALSRTSP